MKTIFSFLMSLFFAGSLFAQMSGYGSSHHDGVALGANETTGAHGIALGNAVKMRGYLSTIVHRGYAHSEDDKNGFDGTLINADTDFLIDFSPITAEIHLSLGDTDENSRAVIPKSKLLEQAFGRYSFSSDMHLTFGRQATVLGFDSDEPTNRYAITRAYQSADLGAHQKYITSGKNYVDGIRFNYNNGSLGFVFGLYDTYFNSSNNDGNSSHNAELNDGLGVDLAASIMLFDGFEARLGFATEEVKYENNAASGNLESDIDHQFNVALIWKLSPLTLAWELDTFHRSNDINGWNTMLLANYAFSDFLSATLRYAHVDVEEERSDIFTLAMLMAVNDHFDLNVEYNRVEGDDLNQFAVQGIVSY
jgi:hypothetical protein